MATKKELETEIAELKTIIQGLGGDPALDLEDYIRIGDYHYPKTAAVTLKWSGEYCEFKRDDSFYFEEHGESMMARLKAWGITEDEEELSWYVSYGGPNWQDTRSGIQAKIEQSWSSLSALLSECDVAEICLADEMYITLSLGVVNVSGFGPAAFFNASSIPLTKSGKIGQSGVSYLKSMYSSGVSLKLLEEAVADCSFTASGQKSWKTFLEEERKRLEAAEKERLRLEAAAEKERKRLEAAERKAAKAAEKERLRLEKKRQETVAAFESSLKDPSVFTSLYCESVSGGTFQMGALPSDGEAWDGEKPRHKVKISSAMVVMKYPVAQKVYENVMGSNPSGFKGGDRPVEQVNWYDAVTFANALSQRCGLSEAYRIDGEEVSCDWNSDGWRLPTEAEWEYLARGGEEHLYAGSDDIDSVAWHWDNSGYETHPVGQKSANGFGLYDMSGNVWEWCWDYMQYDDDFELTGESLYSSGSVTDPRGPSSGSAPVFRGGSWNRDASFARASHRGSFDPSYRYADLGFRLLRKKT